MGGKIKAKKRIGFFHIVLLVCVFVLGGVYIFEASSAVKYRFARDSIEKDIAKLREETKELEIIFSEVSSLNNLKELSSVLNLEEAKNISYIRVKSTPLVLGL